MKIKYLVTILLLQHFVTGFTQHHYQRFENIDIQHYKFEIHLNDTTDRIEGRANVSVKFLKTIKHFTLDLIQENSTNKGMSVHSVMSGGLDCVYTHTNNKLEIQPVNPAKKGQIIDFQIKYSGIPADGLIISENSHGERTFFGDNWPNRAKHWLPTVDHPSDKATLEFKIYAPQYYELISNGNLVKKKQIEDAMEFTHWKEDVPVPTKLMVIGAAQFAVDNTGNYEKIPVSSWVFEKDKETGFQNYQFGAKALKYFSELIGPYPYSKLAHVQSKTRYGGMENAGCIFYHERTATSKNSQERLFAHEVAHQWFGNSVTEQNWHHVWLSEGFATYLTHIYNQHFYGDELFRKGLKQDSERVIRYFRQNPAPIIDTTVTEYIRLLNANSYQKASWVLHMLRMDLGDQIFFKVLQKYYAEYKNSTALTYDFQHIAETLSGKNLDTFFRQWLWQAGHPVLNYNWEQTSSNTISLKILQTQAYHAKFEFPLDIRIVYKDGSAYTVSLRVSKVESIHHLQTNDEVEEIILDPDCKLLFEHASGFEK